MRLMLWILVTLAILIPRPRPERLDERAREWEGR